MRNRDPTALSYGLQPDIVVSQLREVVVVTLDYEVEQSERVGYPFPNRSVEEQSHAARRIPSKSRAWRMALKDTPKSSSISLGDSPAL